MKTLNEEIKLTINTMQCDIDDGAQDVSVLVEALEEARLTLEVMQGRGSSAKITLSIIERALAAHRKGGDA